MSMNDEDKDKWVDDLLAQLPAPKPVPQDISEQLDHFLADHISTLEAEARANGNNVVSFGAQRSNRFTSRYQLLVAAAAVLGILTFAGIQTSFFTSQPESSEIAAEPNTNANQPTPIPEESASQESDTTVDQESANKPTPKSEESISAEENNGLVDPEASSSEIQVLGSEGGTEYLQSNAPYVQITESGMDYGKNIDAILDEIAPYGEPGKLNKLSNAQLTCIVKFKLADRVVAVDSGKYNGARVVSFFAIADDGTTKAYITKPSSSCELVKKISIN